MRGAACVGHIAVSQRINPRRPFGTMRAIEPRQSFGRVAAIMLHTYADGPH